MLDLFSQLGKEAAFDALCKEVSLCSKCARMCDSQRVLNRSVGPLDAEIMFIGEAPGRIGADSSGIPFHGDKSGQNFEELISVSGLSRNCVVVTNAVLCNPKDDLGNNATPTPQEIKNCAGFLQRQIELINPKVVVTLGAKSLEATKLIQEHGFTLRENVRTSNNWFNRVLIPLYHPGQRAMIHRSYANQRSDYRYVFDIASKTGHSIKQSKSRDVASDILDLVNYILHKCDSITYFMLHKVFYLIEYKYFKNYSVRATNAYIVRQKDGPYCTDLHLAHLKKSIPTLSFRKSGSAGDFVLTVKELSLFNEPQANHIDLSDEIRVIADEVLYKYSRQSNEIVKTASYMTRPMRNILKYESDNKVSLYNTPIDFLNL